MNILAFVVVVCAVLRSLHQPACFSLISSTLVAVLGLDRAINFRGIVGAFCRVSWGIAGYPGVSRGIS